MLIVNSGLPLMKARVPSSGSTRKNASRVAGTRPAATASSAITGIPGAARCSAFGQHLLGLVIGDGDGRRVGLRLHRHAGGEVRHLDATGRKHGGEQRLDQRTVFL